ncbi:MAG: histidine triad nucleotide-binding protein [bacterium]
MSDCIFCKIVKGEIPSQLLYEDDEVLAFKDINPQAPTHVLVIPKKHYSTLNEIDAASSSILASLFRTAQTVAHQLGIREKGYRCVMNTNPEGGQSVYHVHLHVLGGRQLGPSMVG